MDLYSFFSGPLSDLEISPLGKGSVVNIIIEGVNLLLLVDALENINVVAIKIVEFSSQGLDFL